MLLLVMLQEVMQIGKVQTAAGEIAAKGGFELVLLLEVGRAGAETSRGEPQAVARARAVVGAGGCTEFSVQTVVVAEVDR